MRPDGTRLNPQPAEFVLYPCNLEGHFGSLSAENAFEKMYRSGIAKKALYYVSYVILTLENVDAVIHELGST